ncbi:MAG: class I SAM-dependent methyltransferase [Immundisolibacter sp.]
MDDAVQAAAYAQGDFAAAHQFLVDQAGRLLGDLPPVARVLDLGCGPGDVTVRFARVWPGWHIDAVDGAEAMLALARQRLRRERLQGRVRLYRAVLPHDTLPGGGYRVVLSNSLLHHLHDPQVLWSTVSEAAAPGAAVYVTDLRRPAGEVELRRLIETYGASGPAVLRRDFAASLRAAFTVQEVRDQLAAAGLAGLEVKAFTDRHLAVFGYLG